jgi:hypothetical protein
MKLILDVKETNAMQCNVLECIQKSPDWVENEINNNSLKSNTKDYGGKTH